MPLHVYQSLWGMRGLPYAGETDWTLPEQLDLVAEAGFDGVNIWFGDADLAVGIAAQAIDRGLRILASCTPAKLDDLKRAYELIESVGRERVDHLNLQPQVSPRTLRECLPYLLGWQAIADDAGVPMYVETHRGS